MVSAEHAAQRIAEKRAIASGELKDDTPVDVSEEFAKLCDACRRGDTKTAQELILDGVSVNAVDRFDYSPLILVSCSG
jgi:ankyrin repeat and BTB/POZ domain-containing protein 1